MKLAILQSITKSNLYHYIVKRHLPFSLFSWRFCLPKQSRAVRLHRTLALQPHPRIPKLLWWFISLLGGLRWILCYSLYDSYRVVQHNAARVTQETGLSRGQQLGAVVATSIAHGVAPWDWYRFKLYRPTNHWSDVIYDHEGAAYHAWYNQQRPDYAAHSALLSDKWQLEGCLADQGITMTDTLQRVKQGDPAFSDIIHNLCQQQGALFCKRRTGNQGIGAFYAEWIGDKFQIQPMDATPLTADQIASYLSEQIAIADYLIQPHYTNHPRLQIPNIPLPATTLRVISGYELSSHQVTVQAAYIEWPVQQTTGEVRSYLFCAVDPQTGKVLTEHTLPLVHRLSSRHQTTWQILTEQLADQPLPYWERILDTTQQAHRQIPGIYRIAWDFILTEQEPILLEGNSGWRVSIPQLLCPGFTLMPSSMTN